MSNEERIYAVTVGMDGSGCQIIECLEFDNERQATMWADDINKYHFGMLCCVLGKDDMEFYMESLKK